MKIKIECRYLLRRQSHPFSGCEGVQEFSQEHASGRTAWIRVCYADSTIVTEIGDIDISDETYREICELGRGDGEKLSETTKSELITPLSEARTSTKALLGILKYYLRHHDIEEACYSVTSEKWGLVGGEMRFIPTSEKMSVQIMTHRPLNAETWAEVQASLNSGRKPLAAMRHLHRALKEQLPHHKWIDATIAAELAIKEVLCLAHPAMEPLLIDVPSPPFSKLYGRILKVYLGEESPFKKKLIAGQEKRNLLVHRPGTEKIEPQEANDYVSTVEAAIFHLLSLLYPSDMLVKKAEFPYIKSV